MPTIRAPRAYVVHVFQSRRSLHRAVLSSLAPYLWAGAVNGGIKIFGVPQAIDLVLIDWKWSWQAG